MKNGKKYVKAIAIVVMLTFCMCIAEARMPSHHCPKEVTLVAIGTQDCDSQAVHTYQWCAIRYVIPQCVISLTNIKGIFSKITNQCTNSFLVSGFSKTLTTDESKWCERYTTQNVGSGIMTGNVNFPVRNGETIYFIWYTEGCSYMTINYGMNNTSDDFVSYIHDGTSFQRQQNNFLLRINGMSCNK